MSTYDPVANYEDVQVTEEPNGEILVTAAGEAVLVRRTGGKVRFRLSCRAHVESHASGLFVVGQTFSYLGIEFVAESVRYARLHRIRGTDGAYFDARTYDISAVSTGAHGYHGLAARGAGEDMA